MACAWHVWVFQLFPGSCAGGGIFGVAEIQRLGKIGNVSSFVIKDRATLQNIISGLGDVML